MADFRGEIYKLEEVSQSIGEKAKGINDIDQMAAVQHVQQSIHAAYVSLQRLEKQQQKS
jgi:hypothetical protein